jgi:hypothetical protein
VRRYLRYVCVVWTLLIAVGALNVAPTWAQGTPTASIRGVISDPSGAVIPGAAVTLFKSGQQLRKAETDENGSFTLIAPPGTYSLRVTREGFTPYEFKTVNMSSASLTLNAQLKIASENVQVDVNETVQGVSTEAGDNLGAIVLRQEDLQNLSDNPEDLADELQALAGPSAGPNGGQIFIDGFSGGRLPPKSAIREVRINQNPYAPEFDRIGFGRIEVFTKPGADQFRGSVELRFGDNFWNARNPFLQQSNRPEYNTFGPSLNFGGPINKRSSFNLDLDWRRTDESALINATVLDSNLSIVPFTGAILSPQRTFTINPRYDYAISDKHTFIARYQGDYGTDRNNNVGGFNLASRAITNESRNHSLQLSETAVLNAKTINELRFQFLWTKRGVDDPNFGTPGLVVQDAFNGGGSQAGDNFSRDRRFEIQDFISIIKGAHTYKLGGRWRFVNQADNSPQNFVGTYTFASQVPSPVLDAGFNVVPGQFVSLTNIQRFQRSQQLLARGFSGTALAQRGGLPDFFGINVGQPFLDVNQSDLGLFVQDDWKVKPTLTLSYGLRWEGQNNISDNSNFAPRFGMAWGIDGGKNRQAKTVLRVNAGLFYDRFNESLVLQANRANGLVQQQFQIPNPLFYPNLPTAAEVASFSTSGRARNIRQIDSDLSVPMQLQYSVAVERALPKSSTITMIFLNTRATHQLRTRNINAPINGIRPYAAQGINDNLLNFESTGFLNQRQLLTFFRGGNINFAERFSKSPIKQLSMFGFYSFGFNRGDTDGAGSQPSNPYDMSTEYGRTAFDVRHRFNTFINMTMPWKLRVSPIISTSTGGAFNITTSNTANTGNTAVVNRPSITTDATRPGVRNYNGILLDPNPLVGAEIIERNFGQSPGFFSVNARVSRTWGFGKAVESGGGGGGGMMGGMMGGRGMRGGPMGMMDGATNKRYNLTWSLQANNLLNRVNLGQPNGNLNSPFFNQSLNLAGGFGGGPGGGGRGPGGFGFGGGSQAFNRSLQMQLRFSF